MRKEKKEMESQEVVKSNGNLPASQQAWGAKTADSSDLLISKVLLMQGTSVAVGNQEAKAGQIVDSVTLEVLGSGLKGEEKTLKVIPLFQTKSWVRYEVLDGGPEWKEEVPYGPENADLKWEEEVDGVKWRNDASLNYYVMLADQVDDPTAIPFVISFRRTMYRTGRAWDTYFKRCEGAGVPPASTVFELGVTTKSKDKNTWWIYTSKPAGKTTPKALETCYKWYTVLEKGRQ